MLVTATRVLFAGLIDYAGLFPPASLDMPDAVAQYRASRAGLHAWLLGRFICPASRLEDLAARLTSSMSLGEQPWDVSVILDGDPAQAAALAQAFEKEMNPGAAVTMVEARLPAEASDGRSLVEAANLIRPIVRAATSISPTARPFLEVARSADWEKGLKVAVEAIHLLRIEEMRHIGAKLRCGGSEPSAFPTPAHVARFIVESHAHDLPYKATAGLHHAVRHPDPDLDVMQHGFLNLLFASAAAAQGASEDQIVAILEETDPAVFEVGTVAMRWRGLEAGVAAVRRLRAEQFVGYGSCSFDEPIEDLTAIGLLGRG